jgi:hypothetical protein
MTKPHGTDAAGRMVDLIGQPLRPGHGTTPGIIVIQKGLTAMPEAQADGTYTLNGGRFKIRKGDAIPDGAEMEEAVADEAAEANDEPEARDKGAAPENRAKAEKR